MIKSVAFFISPDKQILFVETNHIGSVINDPGRFGFTIQEIKNRYAGYGEPLGVEGGARREILLEVIRNGWIRLRRYPNRFWSITLERFPEGTSARLKNWAWTILEGTHGIREDDPFMPVRITQLDGTVIENYSISDLSTL